jgi:hypothetical protein
MWTAARVAALFALRHELVAARCELGLIPDAKRDADGLWVIPEASVRQMAGQRVQPLFTVEQVAALLGVSYFTLSRRVANVLSMTEPLPAGKTVRALSLFLSPDCKGLMRIPEQEVLRVMGMSHQGKEAA